MNRQQKMAWFALIFCSVAFVSCITAVTVLYFYVGMPKALAGFAFIGLMGFGALAGLMFRKKKGQIELDERDKFIREKARYTAFKSAWGYFILGCMIPWFIIGPKGAITVNALPWLVFGGMFVFTIIESIATLVLYSKGGKENE